MVIIKGTAVSEGIAMGPVRFLDNKPKAVRFEKIDDPEYEAARFENARRTAYAQLDELYQSTKEKIGEEEAAIFDIHMMMLEDLDYLESVTDIIRSQSVKAEYAVSQTAQNFSQIFSSMDDEYMKERAADVADISERIQRILAPELYKKFELQVPSIVAANDVAPSEAVQLEKNMVLGIVTQEGSAVSHTAILARSMLIPAVVATDSELNAGMDGKPAILDGLTGTLYIDPDKETTAMLSVRINELRQKRESLNRLKGRPNVTLDGKKIDVFVNVNHLSNLNEAIDSDAGGIGLFRSEFLYLEGNDYPTEEEQFDVYKRVVERMDNKKVIIRTLDIGADKQAGYFGLPAEENPAMGLRAIRICLSRPEIFKTQLRALYRASAYGNIAIMFPMVISVREVEDILKITKEVKDELKREKISFNANTELGIMIETPAAVMICDELAAIVDFFSIGTNDLTQYTLAIDRQNSGLADLYDTHHPAILKMIEMTVKSAHDAGIWVGICGELGADTTLTETFLRMGVDELSVSAGMVLPLREKIISLDLG